MAILTYKEFIKEFDVRQNKLSKFPSIILEITHRMSNYRIRRVFKLQANIDMRLEEERYSTLNAIYAAYTRTEQDLVENFHSYDMIIGGDLMQLVSAMRPEYTELELLIKLR